MKKNYHIRIFLSGCFLYVLTLICYAQDSLLLTDTMQPDSLNADSVRKDTLMISLPDSLMPKTDLGEIVIPYRITEKTEPYPANSLYQTWHHEFLTPTSFPKSAVPDTFLIDLGGFIFPTHEKLVTSDFGPRSKTRQHYGVDIKINMKDTIRACFAGRIRMERYEPKGYGYYIVIRHPNGLETIYGHLSKFLVKVNQHVVSGEPIALGGNTGRSSGPHLHLEFRFMGTPLNPNDLINFPQQSLLTDTYTYTKGKKITRNRYANSVLRKT